MEPAPAKAKVIDAAVLSVCEHGLAGTTTATIADRAGVTWGAIQHQFGDKDAIFLALIDRSLDHSSLDRSLRSLDMFRNHKTCFVIT